jgi:hypothetical protein
MTLFLYCSNSNTRRYSTFNSWTQKKIVEYFSILNNKLEVGKKSFFDELSLLGINDFLKSDKYLRYNMAEFNADAINYPFGGLHIVLIGDFSFVFFGSKLGKITEKDASRCIYI